MRRVSRSTMPLSRVPSSTLHSTSITMPTSSSSAAQDLISTFLRWSITSKPVCGTMSSSSPNLTLEYPTTRSGGLSSSKHFPQHSKWKKYYSSSEITLQDLIAEGTRTVAPFLCCSLTCELLDGTTYLARSRSAGRTEAPCCRTGKTSL